MGYVEECAEGVRDFPSVSLLQVPRQLFEALRPLAVEANGPEVVLDLDRVGSIKGHGARERADELGVDTGCSGRGRPLQQHLCSKDLERRRCCVTPRERTTCASRPAHVEIPNEAPDPENDEEEHSIAAWARAKELDCVVWTGLTSNFKQKTKKPFSVAAAIVYLKNLPAEAKVKAAEYVWRSPTFVKTDLRSALEREPWFAVQDG